MASDEFDNAGKGRAANAKQADIRFGRNLRVYRRDIVRMPIAILVGELNKYFNENRDASGQRTAPYMTKERILDYEYGKERMSGTMLFVIASVLKLHVSFFYAERPNDKEPYDYGPDDPPDDDRDQGPRPPIQPAPSDSGSGVKPKTPEPVK